LAPGQWRDAPEGLGTAEEAEGGGWLALTTGKICFYIGKIMFLHGGNFVMLLGENVVLPREICYFTGEHGDFF